MPGRLVSVCHFDIFTLTCRKIALSVQHTLTVIAPHTEAG